jgi:hypothetical protein
VRADVKVDERSDQLHKEIILVKSHIKELEKLKEFQLCGRLSSRWVK